jgi:putative transcriptional regulator
MLAEIVITSDLRYFLTQHNAKLIRQGDRPVSLRQIAQDTGIALSTLVALNTNKAKGIQFDTLSTLCMYFGCLPHEILRYTPDPPKTYPAGGELGANFTRRGASWPSAFVVSGANPAPVRDLEGAPSSPPHLVKSRTGAGFGLYRTIQIPHRCGISILLTRLLCILIATLAIFPRTVGNSTPANFRQSTAACYFTSRKLRHFFKSHCFCNNLA